MMTREEAKKTLCPYRTIQDVSDFTAKMALSWTKDDKEQATARLLGSSSTTLTKDQENAIATYMMCRAEQCPKWLDSSHDETWCQCNTSVGGINNELCPQQFTGFYWSASKPQNEVNPLSCNKCPKRYGYCSG